MEGGGGGVKANRFKMKTLVICRGYTPYTLKYHLDVVNHLKYQHCICVRGAERRTDTLALKAT